MRTRISLFLAALVSACATQLYPQGPQIAVPVLECDHWRAADGVALPLRAWLPAGEIKAVVLALHGMNDYSNAFDGPGKSLAAKGIATYAYDQRGFGAGARAGFWSSTATMAEDARTAARLLQARYPAVPLYLLGESMGGAVALVAASEPIPAIRGVILSAPAVWGRSSMGLLQQAVLWLSYQVAPGWELTGRGLKIQPSDNIEMLRGLSRDPLVIKATRVDAIHGMVDLMDAAQGAVEHVQLPVLLLYGAKDQVIPSDPTWAAIGRLPKLGTSQRVAFYDNGWHMLLRDLQAQLVVDDIGAWIAEPGTALPSGADVKAESKLTEIP